MPRLLLRLEGAAAAAAATILYFDGGHPWWLFVLLALAPDLSMLGYVAGSNVGTATYNAAHTYTLPIVLGTIGVLAGSGSALAVALVWLTHIGVDRAVGYGLKYPTAFRDTHLQKV